MVLIALLGGAAVGQQPARDLSLEVSAKRLALVIGNEAYPKWPLKNPVNDAKAINQVLGDTGFQTSLILNGGLREIERAVDKFIGGLRPGDVAVVYYAGHGIQLNGENYIIPVDFDAKDEADAKYVSYPLSRIQERMENAGARLNVLVVDACRNNPFKSSRAAGGGLATMNSGRGTFIAFATGPGKVADDNSGGSNGLFTSQLVTAIREPGLTLDQIFNRVREQVYATSNQQQLPWTVSSVIGEFRFRPSGTTAESPVNPPMLSRPAENDSGNPLLRRSAAPQPPAAGLGAEAREAYSRGDYAHAMQQAQAALRIDPANREALFALAASQYRGEQFDVFEATAAQALQRGVEIPLLLIHHHTLTGGHPSTLKLSQASLAFDPMGTTDCTQKAFEVPLASVILSERTTGNGQILLNLKVRSAQNRTINLNFADGDSQIDRSGSLPVLVPPAKAMRSMQAIAAVINVIRK